MIYLSEKKYRRTYNMIWIMQFYILPSNPSTRRNDFRGISKSVTAVSLSVEGHGFDYPLSQT